MNDLRKDGAATPIDEEGFLKWAQDLPDPSIYEALRIAQPLTPIRGFGTPENHWRHFEQMHRWPMGFIVTGDAVCAFNPIYGQPTESNERETIKLALSLTTIP